tara:strand:+ start:13188 stop:13448 length:261 start_codon:yes stop_codon:yes gene_type:complete
MKPPANSPPPACPDCGAFLSRVILTKKDAKDIDLTVRRRQCLICSHRFYTTQEVAPPEIPVNRGRIGWLDCGKYVFVKQAAHPQDL